MKNLALQAQLDGCRTTKDGGWVVSFGCGQDQVQQIGVLSKLRDENLFVVVMTEAEYHASTQVKQRDNSKRG